MPDTEREGSVNDLLTTWLVQLAVAVPVLLVLWWRLNVCLARIQRRVDEIIVRQQRELDETLREHKERAAAVRARLDAGGRRTNGHIV